MYRRLALVAIAAAATAVGAEPVKPAAAAPAVTLRIVFPEGFSVRQMTDRVAEVRRIAIRKRNVTPRLTARAYAEAAARARPPRAFARYLRRRSIEGFLFPSLYAFGPSTRAAELVALQLRAFDSAWRTVDVRHARARKRTLYDVSSSPRWSSARPSRLRSARSSRP